jgi:hypothetical protein
VASRTSAILRRRRCILWFEPSPIERMPEVPVASIQCSEERSVNPAWSRRVASERPGVTAIELRGGQSPMVS